ncbi:diguanylate cyclase [Novosphingobium sp. KA1]|uniref:GGDEF domain-containing protein n=1 Tax=Novosphingobium sp. (strain KA1) TaxID=164608 RepID=UPI001A8C60DE|nr:GGDEF domain-containing protein [Novosphingobium sp. KA1]QSR19573.1 diguanylate cyclase [Novosphingobium sp. KA1]
MSMDQDTNGVLSPVGGHIPPEVRAIVEEHADALVALFYDTLLQDTEAKQFLSNAVVENRLTLSLRNWLTGLLGPVDIRQSTQLQDSQKTIGEVHARIKVPVHLVMKGALLIKCELARLLREALPAAAAFDTLQTLHERMDLAITIMSQAYVKGVTARARLDEAYRLFSLDQDVAVEKESQRASLMEWCQNTLFALLRGSTDLLRLSASPFGLWIRHRAQFMFEASATFSDLVAAVEKIDNQLLPDIESTTGPADALGSLQAAVDEISYLLGELFQTLGAMENGRDPLTRALNRRFLPVILGREIAFANENRSSLSVIMIDVDHFKSINDRFGHPIGDSVLRQVAQAIIENVRSSDFVFRYGGEEFLVVLVETGRDQAYDIAERIRADLERRDLEIENGQTLQVSASIGIACHTGHPDQKYLIKSADEALYKAKQNGRNRIEFFEPTSA